MKVFAIAVLALVALNAQAYEKDEGVIVGTDSNLDAILKENTFALVEFYAPWCGHCKNLAPEYAKAAQQLAKAGSEVVLVKVDATENEETAGQYEVQGYPTIKWFVNGEASDFSGGRTAAEIVAWVNKKSGPPAVSVADKDALDALTKDNDVVVVGLFESESDSNAEAFKAVGQKLDHTFAITTSADLAKELGVTIPAVTLLKKFDEGQVTMEDDIAEEAISAFVTDNSLPLVMEFSSENAPKIFGGSIKKHALGFVNADSIDELTKTYQAVAKEFKGQVLFITVNSANEENLRILEYFGISETDLPAVRIIDLDAGMAKYKPSGELSTDNLTKFVQSVLDGTAKRFLKTEAAPADWDAKPVKVLTGENFAEVALDESKTVFVEFYAPWCGHCKQLAPIWDKLGEAFEGEDNVVIAKLDATASELEEVSVESFPTLYMWKAGSAEPLTYEGERTLSALAEYVNEQAGTSVTVSADDDAAGEGDEDDYEGYEDDEEDEGDDNTAGHDEL